jgi:hypothetical protein
VLERHLRALQHELGLQGRDVLERQVQQRRRLGKRCATRQGLPAAAE